MSVEHKVQFGELPPDTSFAGRSKWAAIAAQLRAKPGEWAIVETKPIGRQANSSAQAIKRGIYKAMPHGEFEATVRGTDVWARYVGGQS